MDFPNIVDNKRNVNITLNVTKKHKVNKQSLITHDRFFCLSLSYLVVSYAFIKFVPFTIYLFNKNSNTYIIVIVERQSRDKNTNNK